jgi:hypothetical protein
MKTLCAVLAVGLLASTALAQGRRGGNSNGGGSLVGTQAKEINAQGWENTQPLTLEQCKGKVVVLEFWATW